MKQFNVLDRHVNLHKHYLLEASAGTGKTFSIQNIVVRLLIEPQGKDAPLSLSQILVVTFTRAATRDLRLRVRQNIERALEFLNRSILEECLPEDMPDYLKGYVAKGKEFLQEAKKNLQQALYAFDQAQIFTIHSFCARMLRQFALESDMAFQYISDEDPLPYTELMNIVRDFFRTEVHLEEFCPAQLNLLLKGDADQGKLLRAICTGFGFPRYHSFRELYLQFVSQMKELKRHFHLDPQMMREDFVVQSPYFKNHSAGLTKKLVEEKILRFVKLFDKEDWSVEDFEGLIEDGLVWIKALDPALIKGKINLLEETQSKLTYKGLTEALKTHLEPLIEEASNFSKLLLRMAENCRKLLQRYQYEEEKLSPDDILRKMDQALDKYDFALRVQSIYGAAIIDEFQDTDPLQWQIFSRLFLSNILPWKGYLYLVGDPKQSIYSFRQADIYTYLSAAKALGENNCYSLDVNYRSRFHLVEALNRLFSEEILPDFIPLPKNSSYLPYHPVKASPSSPLDQFDNERGAIHFFIADGSNFPNPNLEDCEQHVFFPFMAQEIIRLKREKGLRFNQFAVLVRNRYQALNLAAFFEQAKIPFQNQRGTSLTDSIALQALTDLIRAVLKPHDWGAIGAVMGSPLLGWSHEDMKLSAKPEMIHTMMQSLRFTLLKKGFAQFFREMLHFESKVKGLNILEELLSREGGKEFLNDLEQIADLVIDYQYKEWSTPEGIISFLDQLHVWEKNEDSRIKRFQDPNRDGVKILTLHFSKGLEFEIVFALGVVNRHKIKENYIPTESEGEIVLSPFDKTNENFLSYCEENDAEKMRQLYVALTRAKTQLYIPIAWYLPSEKMEWGEASPIDLFLAKLKQPPANYKEWYARLRQSSGRHLVDFIEEMHAPHLISYSIHQSIPPMEFFEEDSATLYESLLPPENVSVSSHSIWVSSFTTLQQDPQLKKELKGFQSNLEPPLDGSPITFLTLPPHDFEHPNKTVYTLPANSDTGLIIHHLLEKIDFQLTDMEKVLLFIQPFLEKTPFNKWNKVIGEIIVNILCTSLVDERENEFCLNEIKPHEYFRELPFIYPYSKKREIENPASDGLMKGVIDLFFSYKGRYFLLDWKTNWLGNQQEDYNFLNMHLAMQENEYFLQASLYQEALKRYLKLIENRPFEECFGGTFYLFLRGMKIGEKTGIYFIPP